MAKWIKVRDKRLKDGSKGGAVVANRKTGEQRTLLNPHGKYQKYNYELSAGQHVTNDGVKKVDKKGKPITLSDGQRAYRAGYKSAIIDSAKAYNAKKGR